MKISDIALKRYTASKGRSLKWYECVINSNIESQIEGTAHAVKCPRCNCPFWADREIYTYKLK